MKIELLPIIENGLRKASQDGVTLWLTPDEVKAILEPDVKTPVAKPETKPVK